MALFVIIGREGGSTHWMPVGKDGMLLEHLAVHNTAPPAENDPLTDVSTVWQWETPQAACVLTGHPEGRNILLLLCSVKAGSHCVAQSEGILSIVVPQIPHL